MIKRLAPYILITAAIVLLSGTTAAALYARSDDVRDDIRYDMTAERQFSGAVANRPFIFEDFVLSAASRQRDNRRGNRPEGVCQSKRLQAEHGRNGHSDRNAHNRRRQRNCGRARI